MFTAEQLTAAARRPVLSLELEAKLAAYIDGDPIRARFINDLIAGTLIAVLRAESPWSAKAATRRSKSVFPKNPVTVENLRRSRRKSGR